MKIFELLKKHLVLLGINPNELHPFNWKITMGFLMFIWSLFSNAMFVLSIENITLMQFLAFFCIFTAISGVGICFATIAFQQTKWFDVIGRTEKLTNERLECSKSKALYEETNELVEKISGILYFFFLKMLPLCVIWPPFVISFVKYFGTDLDGDAFELPLSWWLPYNWHCPVGYLIAVALQWMSITYVFFPTLILNTHGIGGFLFTTATTKDIKCILKAINKNSMTQKKRNQIYKELVEFINLYAAIQQIVSEFSDLYQPIFMGLFLRSLLSFCCTMLIVQMESSNHGNYSRELFLLGSDSCNTFAIVFISCELGQRTSNAFIEIKDSIDQFHWYRFPTEVKRILPMVLNGVQEPISLECFGSFSCCREALKKVLNGAYSYFMVLRKFIK